MLGLDAVRYEKAPYVELMKSILEMYKMKRKMGMKLILNYFMIIKMSRK